MFIATISKKGGVGKTTTTVNVAAALAESGFRVLVLDLDANAGASVSLGLTKSELAPGASDLLLRDRPVLSLIRRSATEGLDVLPASVDLRRAEYDLESYRRKELVLRRRLQPVRDLYDFVFIDCPASIGLLTINAIATADCYMVPATAQYLAIEGLEHVVEQVDRLRARLGLEVSFLGLVLNMVDYRIRSTPATVGKIRERFGTKVFAIEIRTNVSLAEAPAYGKTIFQYKPRAPGATAYRLLAEEFRLMADRLSTRRTPIRVA